MCGSEEEPYAKVMADRLQHDTDAQENQAMI